MDSHLTTLQCLAQSGKVLIEVLDERLSLVQFLGIPRRQDKFLVCLF
jgi:hypothetical protein